MPRKGASRSELWTITPPEEEIKPLGPQECLIRAVERLGPFKHRFRDEAQRLGPWEALGGRLALSEQLAVERVLMLAKGFNKHRRLSQNAPRTKNVIENLNGVMVLSALLARHLESLDDMTRHRLQTAGTGINGTGEVIKYPLMELAEVAGLPMPAEAGRYPASDTWLSRLKALSSYAELCLTTFLSSKGLTSSDAADKGGNTDLYRSLYGPVRWNLVHQGWHLYELFKPGEGTGTEGGPFHLFLLDVFEFATGLEPEDNSKLTYWLKRVPKTNRRYSKIVERQTVLNVESINNRHAVKKLGYENWIRRTQEIGEEFLKLEKERQQLWREVYPNQDL